MLGGSLPAEDLKAIREWFADFGGHVAAVNFTAARPMFDQGAVGFGTWMTMMEGLDAMEREQWRSIWPTIEDFRFLLESLNVSVSGDRCMAFAMLHFDSTGIAADGARFPRPGRVTVVFGREDAAQTWRGVHTHLSLNRGVPQQSHGRRPETNEQRPESNGQRPETT